MNGYKKNIPNIHCLLYDDLCAMLENNRDVATAYLSFILPGDILNELFQHFKKDEKKIKDIIHRYLQREFKSDLFSKLEQSGRKTDEDVKIEDIFSDLYITETNIIDADIFYKQEYKLENLSEGNSNKFIISNKEPRFVEKMISLANDCQRRCNYNKEQEIKRQNKFVIIGSAGQGKSTLTQFISQLYRAYFINSQTIQTPALINDFLKKLNDRKIKIETPKIYRLPIRIILTDYSDWITKQNKANQPTSIICYIKQEIESDGEIIELDDLRNLFSNLSLFIIFDGLDEIPASANRNTIVKEIDNFIDIELYQQNSDVILVITTRPQGFKDEFNNEKFTHLKIVELSKEDCLQYLDILLEKTISNKTKKDKQFNILKRAIDNEASARLMRTPLDATIMATLVKRGGNPPEVKYNLYKEYYTTIFDREREKQVFELDKFKIAINSLHEYLGFKLQSSSEQRNESAKITHGDFRKIIKEYFLKQDYSVEEAEENTKVISKVLTNRLVMISELTIDLDNPANNNIGFPVAPIQEYFASLFLINEEEKIVIERLKAITSNSYWRNVLLFVIGYFQNERRQYLIDNIYTACKQENITKDNIAKVGSWLAVDILIENIFSEVPKYEKLFAKELEEILNLSFSDKLNYLLRMPENIINRYLRESIELELSSNKAFIQKITSWYIVMQLPNLFKDIIEKYWPSGNDEIELLKLIVKERKLNNKFFTEKIVNRLNEILIDGQSFDLSYFLSMLSYFEFDNGQISQIIEFIFLSKNTLLNKTKSILKIANKEKIDLDSSYNFHAMMNSSIEINISDTYKRILHPVMQKSEDNIRLFEIFKQYNIEYLTKLLNFYLQPSKITLNQYILSLKNIDNKTFNRVKQIHENWILSYVFENIKTISDIKIALSIVNEAEFGDIKQWLEIENLMSSYPILDPKANDIFIRYSLPSNDINDNITTEYENYYRDIIARSSTDSYPKLKNEFVFRYLTSSFNKGLALPNKQKNADVSTDAYIIINELLKILDDNEFEFAYKQSDINIYQLVLNALLSEIKKSDINKLIIENNDNIFSKLSIVYDANDFPLNEPNKNTLELLVNTLNLAIASDIESSIIRFIFLTFISKNNIQYLKEINYSQLRKISYSKSQNEISRLFIILLIEVNSKVDLTGTLNQLISKYSMDKYIGKYLVEIFTKEKFELSPNIEIVNNFYQLVKTSEPENYILHGKFETVVKNKIESVPSGFNNDIVKQELKLEIK